MALFCPKNVLSDPMQDQPDTGQRIQYEAMVLATGLQCREPKATGGHA